MKNWLIRVTVNQCKMLFRSPWRKVEDIGEYAEKELSKFDFLARENAKRYNIHINDMKGGGQHERG